MHCHGILLILLPCLVLGGRRFFSRPLSSEKLELLKQAVGHDLPQGARLREQFAQWKEEHGVRFDGDEDNVRMALFARGLARIQSMQPTALNFRIKPNIFTALSDAEFRATLNPGLADDATAFYATMKSPSDSVPSRALRSEVPSSVDWRDQGAVSVIKDQGECGGCWAFAATGALEGLLKIRKGVMVSLSEQHSLDCTKGEGQNGCNGGNFVNAWHFVSSNKGTYSEPMFPYAEEDLQCEEGLDPNATKLVSTSVALEAKCGVDVDCAHNEAQLMALVAEQPVAVAIRAYGDGFRYYAGGIIDDWQGCYGPVDHAVGVFVLLFQRSESTKGAVVVVGYGTDEATGLDYWLIKNSWGTQWGEAGYAKLLRSTRTGSFPAIGMCMIYQLAVAPKEVSCVAPGGDCAPYNTSEWCTTEHGCSYIPPPDSPAGGKSGLDGVWYVQAFHWLFSDYHWAMVTAGLLSAYFVVVFIRTGKRREETREDGYAPLSDDRPMTPPPPPPPRLTPAERYMRHGDDPMNDAAFRAGFEDQQRATTTMSTNYS